MTGEHQFAGGSWIGRDHRLAGRNNQDGWTIVQEDDVTIGVLADGCGSGVRSEVGSLVGVRVLAQAIRTSYFEGRHREVNWPRVQQYALSQLDVLARSMGGAYRKVIEEYFLFTLVGFVIDQNRAVFFTLGDGTVIINDESIEIGPYPDNAPPYLGYCLIQDEVDVDPALLQLQVVGSLAVEDLESFLIATDGIDDFIAREQAAVPGLSTQVGPLNQFYEEDRYFANPELISRRLKLIGRDWPVNQPQPGLLHDDTTLIVGRRAPTS